MVLFKRRGRLVTNLRTANTWFLASEKPRLDYKMPVSPHVYPPRMTANNCTRSTVRSQISHVKQPLRRNPWSKVTYAERFELEMNVSVGGTSTSFGQFSYLCPKKPEGARRSSDLYCPIRGSELRGSELHTLNRIRAAHPQQHPFTLYFHDGKLSTCCPDQKKNPGQFPQHSLAKIKLIMPPKTSLYVDLRCLILIALLVQL